MTQTEILLIQLIQTIQEINKIYYFKHYITIKNVYKPNVQFELLAFFINKIEIYIIDIS